MQDRALRLQQAEQLLLPLSGWFMFICGTSSDPPLPSCIYMHDWEKNLSYKQ